MSQNLTAEVEAQSCRTDPNIVVRIRGKVTLKPGDTERVKETPRSVVCDCRGCPTTYLYQLAFGPGLGVSYNRNLLSARGLSHCLRAQGPLEASAYTLNFYPQG